jgi:hypothetical protein
VDIVLGKVDLATVWTAKNKNTLTLFVSKTLTIWLEYQDAALQKINAAQEKAKSKKQ